MPDNQKPGSILLHFCLLSALAIAQPLYSLIGQNPEFLVAHNMTWLPVIGFVLFLSALIPAVLFALYLAAARINSKFGAGTLFVQITILALIALLPVSARSLGLDGIWALTAATGGGLLVAALYFKSSIFCIFLSVFSFAALAFPLLFLLYTPASELISGNEQPRDNEPTTVTADNPVFIFVFDEFPTLSILDSAGNIDSGRFPNLGALQQDAVWYRNNSANSNSTLIAIPALLSGNMPYGKHRGLPTDENFPDNIFVLLGGQYSVHAAEHATRLCPVTVCGEQPNELRLLLSDTAILLANIVAPPAWAAFIPAVNNDWKNFANLMDRAPDPETIRGFQKNLNWGTRIRDYNSFVETITAELSQLYYFHAMLPHATWKHFPDGSLIVADESGGILAARPNSDDLPFKHMWHDDEAAMRVNRQRHILQTGLVDTLIGSLVDHLKSLGIYDQSMVVITSDHGVSFQPGSARRNVYQGNLVEISAVPLFIKYPGNAPAGVSDVNAQVMDIIPTVLDVLGSVGEPDHEGMSLLDTAAIHPDKKVLREANKKAITIGTAEHLELLKKTAASNAVEYGEHDFASLYGAGDRWGIRGMDISSQVLLDDPAPQVEIAEADMYHRINPSGGFLPLVAHGSLNPADAPLLSRNIALSVNGTIRSVSQLLKVPGMLNAFQMLLPPDSFTEGANQVEAWLVVETDDGIALQRTETAGAANYLLNETADGDTMLSVDSVDIKIEHRIVRGGSQALPSESEKLVLLSGWAADLENGVAAETVVIFIDGEFYSALVPSRSSNSVAERFSEPALANCAFRIPVALSSPEQAAAMSVRVFAISIDQRASELSYSADPARWPFKRSQAPL